MSETPGQLDYAPHQTALILGDRAAGSRLELQRRQQREMNARVLGPLYGLGCIALLFLIGWAL